MHTIRWSILVKFQPAPDVLERVEKLCQNEKRFPLMAIW